MGNFKKIVKDILNNKYFLYFIGFLYIINLLTYINKRKTKSVIVLLLITFGVSLITKNTSLILLVSLILFHFVASLGSSVLQEGMTSTEDSSSQKKPKSNKSTIDDDKHMLSTGETHEEETQDLNDDTVALTTSTSSVDTFTNADSLEQSKMEGGSKKKENYIDLASTLEKSYENLSNMLGKEGINNLTNDTEKLMKRQQDLFKSMEAMTPLIEKATNMLGDLNIGGIVNNVSSILKSNKK